MRGVYLLHFDKPFGHAKHYTGYADDITRRLSEHVSGNGSNLVRHTHKAGVMFQVARIWPGEDRNKERRLKRSGSASRYCPICRPEIKIKSNGLSDFILGRKI